MCLSVRRLPHDSSTVKSRADGTGGSPALVFFFFSGARHPFHCGRPALILGQRRLAGRRRGERGEGAISVREETHGRPQRWETTGSNTIYLLPTRRVSSLGVSACLFRMLLQIVIGSAMTEGKKQSRQSPSGQRARARPVHPLCIPQRFVVVVVPQVCNLGIPGLHQVTPSYAAKYLLVRRARGDDDDVKETRLMMGTPDPPKLQDKRGSAVKAERKAPCDLI